jgi:hypothetical protein
MTTKKKTTDVKTPVNTVREDLRVLGADMDLTKVDNWVSQEFLTLAATVLTNIVGALVLVGWVDATSATDIVKAVVATVGAVQTILVNGVLVWKYLAGRAAVETKKAEMRMNYIQAMQAERARAEYNQGW